MNSPVTPPCCTHAAARAGDEGLDAVSARHAARRLFGRFALPDVSGYAIERLAFLTGRRWLAGILSGAAFLVVHSSWGGAQMIMVGFATVIFVGLYLWRRDLPCVILAHVSTDLIGFALARAQL